MPSLNTGNAILSNAIAVNSSYNVGIGGAASGSYKLQVTGNVNADNFIIQPTGYGLLASLSRDLTGSGFGVLNLRNGSNGFIQPAALSVDRTYTLPDASGTIALTSNLSAYLPLAGGTLTGGVTFAGGVYNFIGANRFFAAASGSINYLYTGSTNLTILNQADTATLFTLANTGAANFSGNITASGGIIVYGSNNSGSPAALGTSTAKFQLLNGGVYGMVADVLTNGNTYLQSQRTDGNTAAYNLLLQPLGGNVGIGTSSPSQKLHVLGGAANTQTLVLESSIANANAYAVFKSTAKSYITGLSFDFSNSYIIYDETAAAARMVITSGGMVGIGSTGYSNFRLQITAATSDSTAFALGIANSNVQDLFYVRNDGLTSTGTRPNSPYNNTTGAGANAIFANDGTLQRSTSSIKYKTDVRNYDKGLEKVMQLRPVYYKGKNDGDTQYAGLIAEEINDLGLVEFVQYAEDKTPDAIYYANMVSLLVKAIQELNQKVNEQQQTINSLINR